MIQINLLPWREEARAISKKHFITSLVTGCLLSLFLLIMIHSYYHRIASRQNTLNSMLSAAVNEEQGTLNIMGSKAAEAMATETQLNFIKGLYEESYSAVRLLNELVSLVSATISVEEIKRSGNEVYLIGTAKSEDDIDQLITNITRSHYFTQPALLFSNVGTNGEGSRNFNIKFEQKGFN